MKVNNTIEDVRLRSNLNNIQTSVFTKKHFYTILGFTQSHLGPLGDNECFVQKIRGSCVSEKMINNTGIEKIHLRCKFNNGGIVDGVREPILFSFGLAKPPGNKV